MNINTFAFLLCGALTHFGAFAHEGHGLPGSVHWHPTDALGLVGLVAVAAALWHINKHK